LIAKLFPQKYRVHVTKSWEVFFYNFVEDLSGFAPFFIISAFSTFLSLAEATSFGKINSILQILFFALMIKLPIISLVVKIMRLKRLGSKKKLKYKKIEKNSK
jgi:amino acid transporter